MCWERINLDLRRWQPGAAKSSGMDRDVVFSRPGNGFLTLYGAGEVTELTLVTASGNFKRKRMLAFLESALCL